MAQPSTHIALHNARLIRLLRELAVSEVEPSPHNFGGRLGQLFALSDSISLSEMHAGLARTQFEARAVDNDTISAEFLQSQKKVVTAISHRFAKEECDGNPRHCFPALRTDATAEQLSSYDSYRAFYAAMQRDMDREVQYMLSVVRDAAAGLSPTLAQLVVIDTTLADTLSGHSRKLLAQVPRLLGLRFEFLRQQHFQNLFNNTQDNAADWLKPGGWLDRFRLDMHQVALAELELRLLPALGLLESILAHISQPVATAPQQQCHNNPPNPFRNRDTLYE